MQLGVRGLILRVVDIRESDRLLTVYTDKMGIITALARGSRNLKSRKMPATGQFCYSELMLSGSDERWTVTEATVIESFFGLRDSLDALSLAGYIAEVVSVAGTNEPDGELMRLSLNSLYALSSGSYQVPMVKAAFEIRCASILGFMPEVGGCCRCGSADRGSYYFDIMAGALQCYDCYKAAQRREEPLSLDHEAHLISLLSAGARLAFDYCISAPLEKLFSFKLSGEDAELFCSAAERYLINHLERSFRSLDFYNEVKS